jgi:hypothetical protein
MSKRKAQGYIDELVYDYQVTPPEFISYAMSNNDTDAKDEMCADMIKEYVDKSRNKRKREFVESPYLDEVKAEAMRYKHVKYTMKEPMQNLIQTAVKIMNSIDFHDEKMSVGHIKAYYEYYEDYNRESIVDLIYLLFMTKIAIMENNIDVKDFAIRSIRFIGKQFKDFS